MIMAKGFIMVFKIQTERILAEDKTVLAEQVIPARSKEGLSYILWRTKVNNIRCRGKQALLVEYLG